MVVCAIAIIPLILIILGNIDQYPLGTSMAATYADGLTAAGTFKGMKYWW